MYECMRMCMIMFVLSSIASDHRKTGVSVVAFVSTFSPQV